MCKSESKNNSTDIATRAIEILQTNTTNPEILDMAIVHTNNAQKSRNNHELLTEVFIINLGNTKVNSTELWFLANSSASTEAFILTSAIWNINNWNPMEIRRYNFSFIPNNIGVYTI